MSFAISRSPVEVSAALSDITFQNAGSEEAAASALFPEASISQARPSDHELVYNLRGDKPENDIGIHFTFTPEQSGQATALKAQLHVPDITLTVSGVHKTISGATIARVLENNLDAIKSALEAGKPVEAPRREFAQLLLGMAVANHQAAINRALAYKSHPDALTRDVLAQFGDEDVALVDNPGSGAVDTAQPGLTQANSAASEPLHEPASGDDGAGTEPKPVE